MNLESKVGVVTGASSGIGRAIALEMGSKKMKLVLAARRASMLQEVSSEVRSKGGEGHVVVVDLATKEGAERVVSSAVEEFGSIDVLVNNAGLAFFGPLEEATDDAIEQIIATNLKAAIYSTRAAIPLMKSRGGAIVNISSLSGLAPQPWLSLYSTTKAALRAFSMSLQMELKPFKIKVIGVYPGYVRTDLPRSGITTESGRKAGRGGMGRPGGLTEVTRVSEAVVGALERDAEGSLYLGATGRAMAFVATHLPSVSNRYSKYRYERLLKRVGR